MTLDEMTNSEIDEMSMSTFETFDVPQLVEYDRENMMALDNIEEGRLNVKNTLVNASLWNHPHFNDVSKLMNIPSIDGHVYQNKRGDAKEIYGTIHVPQLSADDEAYLLNEVLKYHPNKAEKMGTGVDHIVINKHSTYQNSRCFYVQRTDGQHEDFSTKKCMMNLIGERFPDIAENFIRKYYPRQADKERNAAAKEMDSAAGTPQAD